MNSAPGRRPTVVARLSLLTAFVTVYACSLSNHDYEPVLVGVSPLAPDAGETAPPVTCAGGACDAGCTIDECGVIDAGSAAECPNGDCSSGGVLELDPSCADGVANGEESGVDCGGRCPNACAVGVGCVSDADCVAGAFCPPASGLCTAASCSDGVRNGVEAGVDCGGGACAGCADGGPCEQAADCASGVCEAGACAVPSCTDATQNAAETDVDCGGPCLDTCAAGQRCEADADCGPDLFCPELTLVCTAVSCSDGALNGSEILADCGGGECPGCPEDTPCESDDDCETLSCVLGECAAASCNDDVANQDETGVDCGGGCAAGCDVGVRCRVASDCDTGVCGAAACPPGGAPCCQAPACDDDVTNGTELDVDCGNGACGPCGLGAVCNVDGQCTSDFCLAGRCTDPGVCTDAVQNGRETDVDCGGADCAPCADLASCEQAADCLNQNCDARGICISCGDGVLDGSETGVDCGGVDPACRRCNFGESCGNNGDCLLGLLCIAGLCGN